MRHTWSLLWIAAVAGGCASEYKPCVSHTDCASGLVCTEAFVCQQPAPEGVDQCVSARQYAGLYPVSVSAARFRGDVGPFRGFGNGACDQAAYMDGHHLTVNTVIPSERGPGMTIFRLRDGVGRGDLTPGKTVAFLGNEDAVVHGCAQWTNGDWGFDLPSDSVTVSVTEATNGDWIYNYTAHYPGGVDPQYGSFGAHEIRGSFQVPQQY